MDDIQRYYLPTGHLVQCTATRIDHDDVVFYPDHVADKAAALAAQAEEHKAELAERLLSAEIAYSDTLEQVTATHVESLAALRRKLGPEPVLFHYEHPSLIVSIDGKEFTGEPCMIHRDFKPSMDRIVTAAHNADVQLFVTHSVRRLDQVLEDTVVEQALRSNHHAGSGVDLNVVCDGEWFNSEKLRWGNVSGHENGHSVRRFLSAVRLDDTLRWGGNFSKPDPVHFDDNLVLRDPDEWQRRVTAIREEMDE